MKRHARHYDGSSPVSFPLAGRAAIGAHHQSKTKSSAPIWTFALLLILVLCISEAIRARRAYNESTTPHSTPAASPSPNVAPTPPVFFRTPPEDDTRIRGLDVIAI